MVTIVIHPYGSDSDAESSTIDAIEDAVRRLLARASVLSPPIAPIVPGGRAGVLGGFIRGRRDTYTEPSRAGTPKGERIGLSGSKYQATLLALTNVPLAKVAGMAHVSYGLLKKWRTEEEFQRQVEKHVHDFLDEPYLVALVVSAVEDHRKSEAQGRLPIEELAKADEAFFDRIALGFDDIAWYGKELLVEIVRRQNALVTRFAGNRDRQLATLILVQADLLRVADQLAWKVPLAARLYQRVRLAERRVNSAVERLAHADFSHDDRVAVVLHLRHLALDLSATRKAAEKALKAPSRRR
jgi:hypothetical protein